MTSSSKRQKPAEFWGTASAMINYRSGDISRPLPDCVSSRASMTGPDGLETEADPAKAITWSRVTRITYKDCAVTLDAPATHNIFEYTKGADVKFVRCKVTYRRGPV